MFSVVESLVLPSSGMRRLSLKQSCDKFGSIWMSSADISLSVSCFIVLRKRKKKQKQGNQTYAKIHKTNDEREKANEKKQPSNINLASTYLWIDMGSCVLIRQIITKYGFIIHYVLKTVCHICCCRCFGVFISIFLRSSLYEYCISAFKRLMIVSIRHAYDYPNIEWIVRNEERTTQRNTVWREEKNETTFKPVNNSF